MPGMGPTRIGAGQRRHLAALQEATITTDALGGRGPTAWTEFAQAYVAVNEQPFFKDEQDAAITYLVTLPYRADVVENHAAKVMQRVDVPGFKTLRVVLVQNPEARNRDLILHCVEAD